MTFVALGFIGDSAQALTFQTFSSRTDWERAVGGFTTEDFNSFSSGQTSFRNTTVNLTDFSIQATTNGNNFLNYIGTPRFTEYNIDDTPVINGLTEADTPIFFDVKFSSQIVAFGFDYKNIGATDPETAQITIEGQSFVPDTSQGFLGVIATDGSFTNIRFSSYDSDTDKAIGNGFGLDNFSYASASPTAVPEPSTILATGLVMGIGTFFKKKKSQQ